MKVTEKELDALRDRIRRVDTDEVRTRYRERRFPRADAVRDLNKRYRWDLFYFAKGSQVLSDEYTSDHIDTALRHIVAPL